jgi:hypothetical protein
MRRNQMFPQRFLSAADVQQYNPIGVVVTVQGVIQEVFGKKGQEEIVFFLKFLELRKPYKLNKTNADALFAEVDDTDDWIGKKLRITPFDTYFTDQDKNGRAIRKEVTTASLQFVADNTPSPLPPNTDLTEYGYEVDHGIRKPLPGAAPRAALPSAPPPPPPPPAAPEEPIGQPKADAFLKHIRAVSKTFDDFLRFAYAQDQSVYAKAYGKEIADIPQSVLPMMRAFMATLGLKTGADVAPPSPPPPPPPPPSSDTSIPVAGEVIDQATGEVVSRMASVPSEISPLPKGGDPFADVDLKF